MTNTTMNDLFWDVVAFTSLVITCVALWAMFP